MDNVFMNVKNQHARRVGSVADIGEIMRRERKRQGVTQAVAAQLCGVSVHFLEPGTGQRNL